MIQLYTRLLKKRLSLVTVYLCISDKYSVAYVTVPNTEVGKTIGRGLVKEKLAACVNIIPQVTSIYEWKNEINEDNEVNIRFILKHTVKV